MNLKVLALALGMLLTGTINTISTKFQDLAVVGHSADGVPLHFKHPALQSACMFFGELLCLLPFFARRWRKTDKKSSKEIFLDSQPRSFHFWRYAVFALPASCDALATTLMNVGLYYTYASTYQMLRGTLVLFAGFFTIVILRRMLYIHHWCGLVLITGGAALVGAASVIGTRSSSNEGRSLLTAQDSSAAPAPLFGDIMVVLAQMFTALQFVVEEKYMRQYRVPPLLAVGMEGAWGLVICSVAVPVLAHIRDSDGLPIDDAMQGMKDIFANGQLFGAVAGSILSIAFFNFFGISVTRALSGAARAAIDACRTVFIWAVSLAIGWEHFLWLEVLGFVVLMSGSALYNEVILVCLPKPPAEDGSSSSGSSEAGDEEEGLLADQEASDAVQEASGSLRQPLLSSPSQQQPFSQGGPVLQQALSRPIAMVIPEQQGHRQHVHGHRNQQTESVDDYTLARSVRVGISTLHPHALDETDSITGTSQDPADGLSLQQGVSAADLSTLSEQVGEGADNELSTPLLLPVPSQPPTNARQQAGRQRRKGNRR